MHCAGAARRESAGGENKKLLIIQPVKIMKLQEILIGNTPKAQTALNAFFDGIDEERILWYPSSASDYRDIVETSAPRQLLFEPPLYDMEAPNIFCHSDYFKKHIRLKNDVLFDDQKTVVRLLEKHSVSIRPEIDFIYKIDPKNAAFIDEAPVKPTIYFLKLKVESVVLGEINVGLFYFLFENYYLLEQVFLKNDHYCPAISRINLTG